jgi:hypothetical protein
MRALAFGMFLSIAIATGKVEVQESDSGLRQRT